MKHSTLDLVSATISTISQAIRQRHLSPVELVTATLERIDALQPRLQCFTTVTPEYALQRAREAEQEIGHGRYRGPLHGIPYALPLSVLRGMPNAGAQGGAVPIP